MPPAPVTPPNRRASPASARTGAAAPRRPTPAPSERRLAVALFSALALLALGGAALIGGVVADGRAPGIAEASAWGPAEPPAYRDTGPDLLVCPEDPAVFTERNGDVNYNRRIENERRYEDCTATGHHDLAAAIDAAQPGATIGILPGQYTADETIRIGGTGDLQIEGLGDSPDDVLLSARFAADTVLEARGASMLYLKGFTVGQAREHGLHLTDVQGAVVESVAAVQSGGYGLRITDSPAVTLTDCRAEAADTAGISIEDATATVTGCEATGNLIGLRVSGAHPVQITENRLHDNTTGLVVTDTARDGAVRVEANVVHDNNTDHYANLGATACDGDLAERAWADGVLCPDHAAPSGVGILVADAVNGRYEANRLWNQRTAAVAVWGSPGLDAPGSDQNRFADNVFGVRDDGQQQRNRLDLSWDGIGADNCFQEPGSYRTAPHVLPGCGMIDQTSRVLGDPLRAFKIDQCGLGPADPLPAGCDWLGAPFTDRLEFQAAVAFAAALLFLTGAGWLGAARAPNPPRAGQMTFSAIATGAGGLLLVIAVWSGRADYEALALGLWGCGWLLAGRSWYHCGIPFFGSFTALIGAAAVLDAIDRAVWTIAPLPLSPAWFWLALLPLWTLFALAVAFGPRIREEEPPQVRRTPVTAPARDRFDW